jgi:NAD(P)-dependent dehydrogenase (short-subunit alcohol dehydrogenase family)
MSNNNETWFITGAGRGLGVDLAKAALAAGHNVVAAGRNTATVARAVGEHEHLLVVQLDITDADQAAAAVSAAVERFGRIDVLVNNAGNFVAGFFEELSRAQVEAQVTTLLFGTMNVTRAVLPTMRAQRAGAVVSISSVAGIVGQRFCSAYAAAKFGVEGFMESLAAELEQFGITTTIVEPGFFRTDLLTPQSTTWAELSIADYAEQSARTKQAWQDMNGQQGGDPAKLAAALVSLLDAPERPARWAAGADAVEAVKAKARTLLAEADAHRVLSSSLAYDD